MFFRGALILNQIGLYLVVYDVSFVAREMHYPEFKHSENLRFESFGMVVCILLLHNECVGHVHGWGRAGSGFVMVCVPAVSTIAAQSEFLSWQNSTTQSVEFGGARVWHIMTNDPIWKSRYENIECEYESVCFCFVLCDLKINRCPTVVFLKTHY